MVLRFIPPIVTVPAETVFLPIRIDAIVDFPLPLSPTIPVKLPSFIVMEIS